MTDPKPHSYFSELVDENKEVQHTSHCVLGPMKGNHGIQGWEWRSVPLFTRPAQPLPETWDGGMEMLNAWLVGKAGPLVGVGFSLEEADILVKAAYIITKKQLEKPEFAVKNYEEKAQ